MTRNYFALLARRRTVATAFVTSLRRIPLCLPAFRACWTSAVKSRFAGGCRTLKITTSLSPSTTNCAPALSPRRTRISSGMTTCPLDDRVVVAASLIAAPGVIVLLVRSGWARRDASRHTHPWSAPLPGAYGDRARTRDAADLNAVGEPPSGAEGRGQRGAR